MRAFRMVPVAFAVALAACSPETTSTQQASAFVVTSKTALTVGDTMLVKAGLLYGTGRFEEFTTYTVTVADTSIARVLPGTKIVQGKALGDALVRVRIPGDAAFAIDTTFRVNAAP